MKRLICLLLGHRWVGYMDLAVCHCERCGKELRGIPASKAIWGEAGMKYQEPYNDMEKAIHRAFHNIASKYNVDVDLVANIISSYDEEMSCILEKKVIVEVN